MGVRGLQKIVFVKNAVILTGTALLLRAAGILFRVWTAGRLGAEGMGLYQLVFSVYVLASAFASSGVSTAVTRLVADELALGVRRGTLRILRRAVGLTLVAAFASAALVFFGADVLARFLLGDSRAAPALRILCFSLPFLGVSACLRGYFIARRRAGPSAASQLLEQVVRIAVVMAAVGASAGRGLRASCAAVLLGDSVAEAVACLFLALLFLRDKARLASSGGRPAPPYPVTRRLLHIALPIAGGRYLNSGLRTAENVLMPACLTRFEGDRAIALRRFGAVKGMALPLLLFPSSLLGAVSTLLVPEVSEAAARGREARIRAAVLRLFQLTLLPAFFLAALFFCGADEIARLVYHDGEVGGYLRALAPLLPFMYLDSVCDGMLKGLDEQRFTFRNSVADSTLRLPLILLFVPRFGMPAFLCIMYGSNLFTSIRGAHRLLRKTKTRLPVFRWVVKPLLCAATAALLGDGLARAVCGGGGWYLALFAGITAAVYFPLLFLLESVTRDDF